MESAAGETGAAKARAAPYYDERYRERREPRERDPPPAERERERDHRRDQRH